MSGLLICAAVVALLGFLSAVAAGVYSLNRSDQPARVAFGVLGLALIAVALWLAYAAGAQP